MCHSLPHLVRLFLIALSTVVSSCARPEDKSASVSSGSDTATAASPASSAGITLAEVAGKWKLRSTDEKGGNVAEVEMVATGDSSDWILTGRDGKPIPLRVTAVAGDSIVTESAPYESFVRKGLRVKTRTVNRLQDGELVGTIEARYALDGRDSVAHRRMIGTRMR